MTNMSKDLAKNIQALILRINSIFRHFSGKSRYSCDVMMVISVFQLIDGKSLFRPLRPFPVLAPDDQ